MKNTKRIICVMLLLSIFFTLLLPFTASAEVSTVSELKQEYRLGGIWEFVENPDMPEGEFLQYINFTTTSADGSINNYNCIAVNQYSFTDIDYGSKTPYTDQTFSYAYRDFTWNLSREVNFGKIPQLVSTEFYTWFTSVARCVMQTSIKTSDLLSDLAKDGTFNMANYPDKSDDYTLKVIQIAESTSGELYIYVYNPSVATKNYQSAYINMSLQNPVNKKLEYNLYQLSLVDRYGTLDKYKVDNFTVSKDTDRYYNIAGIYREYDTGVDTIPDAVDTIQFKSYSVGQYWHVYYHNNNLLYESKKIDVVEIAFDASGSIRYNNAFNIGKLYIEKCDSHYVAFSIKNFKVDQIFDADITYTVDTYHWSETYTPYNYSESIISSNPVPNDFLSSKETGHNESGWFAPKYEWNRIQTKDEFLKSLSDDKIEFSEAEKAEIANSQFVFRFLETDYTITPSSTGSFGTYSKVENFGILRLHFLSDNQIYNLGAVSDLVGDDNIPEGNTTPEGDIDKFLDEMDEYLGDFLTVMMLVIFVLIILVAVVYLKPLASMIGKGFMEIIGLIWSAVTLPFQLIGSLFSSKRR